MRRGLYFYAILLFGVAFNSGRCGDGVSSPATASVPGVVIDHRPAKLKCFIGSPSLAILANGNYVAAHDFFGSGTTRNRTALFVSTNRGAAWQSLGEMSGQYWSSLFVHRGALYLMGTSGEYGFVVIRRSTDGGRTWTLPRDGNSGVLLHGGRYHTAPVPVILHHGRLWRGMEDAMGGGGWGKEFRAFMMSAPEASDLLQATNWIGSRRMGCDTNDLNGHFGGWLEGNAVVAPDGKIVDVLRVDYRGLPEKAALLEFSDNGQQASFNPTNGFIDFPGGGKKFTIRYDETSRCYWTLANAVPSTHAGKNPERARNTLALASSPDLRHWTVRCVVLYHPDNAKHAFQYADWQFDGDDLAVVSRTAFDDADGGAAIQHDANYLTFHRVKNFRALEMKDSPAEFRELNKK